MAQVIRVKNTRLGLSFGSRRLGDGGRGDAAWGWALIRKAIPKPQRIVQGDPLDLARAAASDWDYNDGPFTLFVYETDEAYCGTQGHKTGLPRMEHWLMVGEIARKLADEGTNVTVMEVS